MAGLLRNGNHTMDISYTDVDDDDDDKPVAETRDIPQETLNVVNHRLAAAGCNYQLEATPGDIEFDYIRQVYDAAADETCNLIKHALAVLRPELHVID
jgi:hypothetical protein